MSSVSRALDVAARVRQGARDLAALRAWGTVERGMVFEDLRVSFRYVGRLGFADDFSSFSGDTGADEPERVSRQGGLRAFRRGRAAIDLDADVVVVDPWFGAPAGALPFTPHLQARLAVLPDMQAQLAGYRSRGNRRRAAELVKRGVRWRVSTDARDFDRFYDEMYVPFARLRFGPDAHVSPRAELARVLRRGALILVDDDDGGSGVLVYRSRRTPGVLYGLKDGAAGATSREDAAHRSGTLDVALLEYAQRSGARTLDLGLTCPMAHDGVFAHKRHLGCTFRPMPGYPRFHLCIAPAARASFLRRAPLVFGEAGAMTLAIGYEAAWSSDVWPEALEAAVHELEFNGLSRVEVYTPAERFYRALTHDDPSGAYAL